MKRNYPLHRRLALASACIALAVPASWAQQARPITGSTAPTATPPVVSTTVSPDQETIELSPFTVDTTKESGYFAENTLAGSRLRTNIGDLAASITVVTKQQLEDTGSVDINDVFRYEANTEGASSYTPPTVSRGIWRDSIGGWSNDVDGGAVGIATANRVRGLGSADTATNNYPTISRIIFDSYNTNSVEINRGPNSMLFGTGGASGIVNQSMAEAVLNRQSASITLRGGSFGAKRASFSGNVPIGSKLAIFVAGLYDSKGFQRKPSSDIYRREYAALTFKPTRSTKLTASYERYSNFNNRPNYAMPIDYVTEWIQAGKPGFDPTTQMVTFANGTTKGPYLISTLDKRYVSAAVTPVGTGQISTTTSPLYVPSLQYHTRNTVLSYDDGNLVSFWVGNALQGSTGVFAAPADAAKTQAQWLIASEYLTSTRARVSPVPPASTGATIYGQWSEVALSDKSIYDYTQYNVQGSNYGTQAAKTYSIEWQQEILPNLNFSAGWFRQEMQEMFHYGMGQANDATRIYVDTNTKLMNGQPNPYFGSPFLRDWQVDSFSHPEINNNLRAMLAYELDMRNNSGWTQYLGHHRFLGLASQQWDWNDLLRYRIAFDGGDPRFLPTAAQIATGSNWASNAANIAHFFYVGQNGSGLVQRGVKNPGVAGYGGADHARLQFYDWTSNSWSSAEMNFDPNLLFAGSSFGLTTRKTDSSSFSWQGYLWKDRLMPTFGVRRDRLQIKQNDRTGIPSTTLYPGGFGDAHYATILGAPFNARGQTKTLGGVMRPFSNWGSIDRKAEGGSFIADVFRTVSFHYNTSDNFNAPSAIQTDYFGNTLANPSGKGKDYGVGASFFNNKLFVRLNWYKNTNENARSAAGATPAGRASRIDYSSGIDWARQVTRIRAGQDPTSVDFDNNTVYPLTQAQQDAAAALLKLPDYTWPDGRIIQTTESNVSKGKELQLTYNPTHSWTMKLTVGQQQSSYSKAIKELSDWIAYRLPIWQSLSAPDMAPVYVRANGNLLSLQKYWTGYGFSGDAGSNSTGATSTPESTYNGIVVPEFYRLKGMQNTKAPNLREYNVSYLTNYSFQQGTLKGFAVGGNWRWADKAIAGYYGLADPSTYSHPGTDYAIVYPDLKRPIYTPATTNIDVWASYTRKIFSDKVRLKVQLNVRDVNKGGGLIPVQYNPDGSASAFRIIDPRQYSLTTTFEF